MSVAKTRQVLVEVKGGMGNQLFQIAFALHLQGSTGLNPKLIARKNRFVIPEILRLCEHLGLEKADRFERLKAEFGEVLSIGVGNQDLSISELIEKSSGLPRNVILSGYFQNISWPSSVEHNLMSAFSQLYLDESGEKPPAGQKLAWHVRRGDYTTSVNQEIYGLLPLRYYQEASIGHFAQDPEEVVVFCEDRKELDADFQAFVSEKNVDIFDRGSGFSDFKTLIHLSKSENIVIANSTFGWWAAWLSERFGFAKTICFPSPWSRLEIEKPWIPDSWIPIESWLAHDK